MYSIGQRHKFSASQDKDYSSDEILDHTRSHPQPHRSSRQEPNRSVPFGNTSSFPSSSMRPKSPSVHPAECTISNSSNHFQFGNVSRGKWSAQRALWSQLSNVEHQYLTENSESGDSSIHLRTVIRQTDHRAEPKPYSKNGMKSSSMAACGSCGILRTIANGILERHMLSCADEAKGFICMVPLADGSSCFRAYAISPHDLHISLLTPFLSFRIGSPRANNFNMHCRKEHQDEFLECQPDDQLPHIRLLKSHILPITKRNIRDSAVKRDLVSKLLKFHGYLGGNGD